MRGRRTPVAIRAEAVGLASVKGVRAASRDTGLPVASISSWMHSPEFEQLRTRKKEEVAQTVWATFQKGVERVGELIPQTDDALKVATAAAILFDKFALMTGAATERHETRELLNDFADGEKEALEQWLHDLAKERANAA